MSDDANVKNSRAQVFYFLSVGCFGCFFSSCTLWSSQQALATSYAITFSSPARGSPRGDPGASRSVWPRRWGTALLPLRASPTRFCFPSPFPPSLRGRPGAAGAGLRPAVPNLPPARPGGSRQPAPVTPLRPPPAPPSR